MDLRPFIRDVPDFPKPGIIFKDITPLLRSHKALDYISHALAEPFQDAGVTAVAAIESRGFIFGSGVARVLGAGFVPIRKPGKLPWKTRRGEYTLEYGSGVLEIHDDALTADDRVLIIDDLLATGGTAACSITLARESGATVVAAGFVIELTFLDGRRKLDGVPIHALLDY
ncbi:MAG TPA: adenine phosphoribosyltransferase [Thermoanaerobaculia bacterium]|jgi:adenine phosphoribosyltransferase|nr:adenine phosphoribosyltransferase [Thermoanaerobaculia bacterium]